MSNKESVFALHETHESERCCKNQLYSILLNENAKQFEFRLSYTVHYKLLVFAIWNSIGINAGKTTY